jgi:hypothetical protein
MTTHRAPKGGFTHGFSGYGNYGCRCGRCRSGHAEYQRRSRAQRRVKLAAGLGVPAHGNANTYNNWGCHCRPCTAAHAAKGREWRARSTADQPEGTRS